MSSKLVLISVLSVLAYSVNAMPGYGHGDNNGAVSVQNSNLGGGGGYGHGHQEHHHVDYYAKPEYKYAYAVKDAHTGDEKSAQEQRDGEKVTGEYALKEADGSYRRVTYTADHSGFHAQVHRTGGHHPQTHGHGQGQGQAGF